MWGARMKRRALLRGSLLGLVAATAAPLILIPKAGAVPLIGGNGLVPNAANLANYIRGAYPGVLSIGGVRPCDSIGEHCAGRAIDIMVGSNTPLGHAINSDILSQRGRFGVNYTLFGVKDHGDHIHASVY